MSGKHAGGIDTGVNTPTTIKTYPPVYPGTRINRAYAEGRLANKNGQLAGDNPFAPNFDWPEFKAWANGYQWYAQTGDEAVFAELETGIEPAPEP